MEQRSTTSTLRQYKILIPIDIKPQPDKYEEMVARILAQKFQSDVMFVARRISPTPDVQVVRTREFWEIKNIRGNGKFTVEDNLRKAAKQASRVVISLLRSRMTPEYAAARIRYYLTHAHGNITHVILITKGRKTIDFHV